MCVGCLFVVAFRFDLFSLFLRLLRIAHGRRTPQSQLQELLKPTNQTVLLKLEVQKVK